MLSLLAAAMSLYETLSGGPHAYFEPTPAPVSGDGAFDGHINAASSLDGSTLQKPLDFRAMASVHGG